MCGAVLCLIGGYVMDLGFGATVLFYAMSYAVVNQKSFQTLFCNPGTSTRSPASHSPGSVWNSVRLRLHKGNRRMP